MLANHNNASDQTQKYARRVELIEHTIAVGIEPEDICTLSGRKAIDMMLMAEHWPMARYLSIENKVTPHNMRADFFEKYDAEMIVIGLKDFVSDKEISPKIDGMRQRQFDLAYIDFVRPADEASFEIVEKFLTNHVADRFVLAVSNTLNHDSNFGYYAEMAQRLGLEYYENNYQDTSPMGFGIFTRK